MRSTRNQRSLLPATFALVLVVAAWIAFAPIPFGGRAGYVIVSGNSMEPNLHQGDLVVLRAATGYAIGDVVTYRHPAVGPVIHRIIDRADDRFVFKGDHNTWIDSYQPTQDDLIGKLWFRVPSAGLLLARLRTPGMLALLAMAMGVITMTTLTGTPRRWRRTRPFRPQAGGVEIHSEQHGQLQPTADRFETSKEVLLFLFATLTFASLLLAVVAFTRPIARAIDEEISYGQYGSFSYTAAAPPGIYDSGAAQTGDPIFPRLSDRVNVAFSYRLLADRPAEAGGTARMSAEIGDASGWKRSFDLQPETAFSGSAVAISGTVDLARVQALIDELERQTGIERQHYTLAIVPEVQLNGALAGQALQDSFAPRLKFQFDRLQLQLMRDVAGEPEALNPVKQGLLKQPRIVPNTLALPGITLAVTTARWLPLAGLLIALGGALLFGRRMARAARYDEAARIRFKYGSLLLDARGNEAWRGVPIVDVATIDDLAKLAERNGRMIMHQIAGGAHRYLILDDGVAYCYQVACLEHTPNVVNPGVAS